MSVSMSAAVEVTLSQPHQRDIEILRLLENITHRFVQQNDTKKANHSSMQSDPSPGIVGSNDDDEVDEAVPNHTGVVKMLAWMATSQDVLYYAFPIVFSLGVIMTLLCVVGLARQLKHSHDVFLLAFSIIASLLLSCGSGLHLQNYLSHSNTYQSVYGYIKSVNDWLWFSSLWILTILGLERAVFSIKRRAVCSSLQASLVSGLVCSIGLVSALPQLWQYETTETFDYVLNQTIVMSDLKSVASAPSYSVGYFWYTVLFTVLIPYPLMLAAVCILIRSTLRNKRSKNRTLRHNCNHSVKLSRRITEQLSLSRLFVVLLLLYMLLTAPLSFLVLIHGLTPSWSWSSDHLYAALHPIFDLMFYFFYATVFVLLCSYHDSFRSSLVRTFCGRCWPRQRRRQPVRQYKNR